MCGVISAYRKGYRLAKLSIRESRGRLGFATGNRLGFWKSSGLLSEAPRDQSRSKDREAPAKTRKKMKENWRTQRNELGLPSGGEGKHQLSISHSQLMKPVSGSV